ncbi:hypothetical protein [Neptunicella sp. SCSIO 80796]|uniref:hypothetical protein n=1 Tax=Neptunicella plasticusilytica TaxID=3117012 RepID=UPI003A4E015D
MKIVNNSYHKVTTLGERSEGSRRQAYYHGKYRREIFYIGLSVILLVVAAGLTS